MMQRKWMACIATLGVLGSGTTLAQSVPGGPISALEERIAELENKVATALTGAASNDLSESGIPLLIDPTTGALGVASASGTYQPTFVSVTCDGTGTPLSDALNRLNPTAAVYVVEVTGMCNEALTLRNFASLTLRSADPANRASIVGQILYENGNGFVRIESLKLVTDQEWLPMIHVVGVGRIETQEVEFVCDGQDECSNPLVDMIGGGDLRLYGGASTGPWGQRHVGLSRGSVGLVASLSGDECLPFTSFDADHNSTLRIFTFNNCEPITIQASFGSMVNIFGMPVVQAYARNGQIYGAVASSFSSVTCVGAAAVVEGYDFTGNLCP